MVVVGRPFLQARLSGLGSSSSSRRRRQTGRSSSTFGSFPSRWDPTATVAHISLHGVLCKVGLYRDSREPVLALLVHLSGRERARRVRGRSGYRPLGLKGQLSRPSSFAPIARPWSGRPFASDHDHILITASAACAELARGARPSSPARTPGRGRLRLVPPLHKHQRRSRFCLGRHSRKGHPLEASWARGRGE